MISYEVEFPTQKSFSLKIDDYSSAAGLDCRTIEAIGGDVKVKLDNQTMLMVPYRENLTSDFTLEEYKLRAKNHAVMIVEKLFEAAQGQTAKNHEEIFGEKLDLIISLMPPLKV
ncbi:hypothetical protein ACSFCW_09365 [Yokenella regensburgei]|uniref:hypothetical protein n=1 Tax=Yokenella regensburgei TaxID=158877 RepID=UPI003ED88757